MFLSLELIQLRDTSLLIRETAPVHLLLDEELFMILSVEAKKSIIYFQLS